MRNFLWREVTEVIRKKDKASAALVLSAAGVVLLTPYAGTFWGGLLTGGCLAALVGGLADWFAVTALFRRPLGIAYRTAIIPRNRERLLRELLEFTSRDLLTPENILRIVARYDMAALLSLYLEDAEGEQKVKATARRVIERLLDTLDRRALCKAAEPVAREGLRRFRLPPLLDEALRLSREKGYEDEAARFFLREAALFARGAEMRLLLTEVVAAVKAEYEGGLARRQIMSYLVDLSPEHLARVFQDEIVAWLERLQAADHPARRQFREWIDAQRENETVRRTLEDWKLRVIEEELTLSPLLETWLERGLTEGKAAYLPRLDAFIEAKVAELKSDARVRAFVDAKIKAAVGAFVREQHALIARLVQERIDAFSDTALVDFVESRLADDLQMIRINGALVGALAGMLLYAIGYLAERMW